MDSRTDTDDHILLANTRSTRFDKHTPARSSSSFDSPRHEEDEAELSQLLPAPSNQHYPSPESSRRRSSNAKRQNTRLLVVCVGLALSTGLLLGGVLGSLKGGELIGKYKDSTVGQPLGASTGAESGEEDSEYDDVEVYLKSGNATNGFRENLREEWTYITAWNSAGMTNVFEDYCNLIYLGLITQRIPVIPPLVPSPTHLGSDKPLPMINFGDVFDLSRLRKALHSPVLEWKDIKKAHYGEPWTTGTAAVEGVVEEELGCWSTAQVVRGRHPHRSSLETFLKLDVAYTPVPLSAALSRYPDQVTFWELAHLTFEDGRRNAFNRDKDVVSGETLHSKKKIEPDRQFACFDDVYFTNAVDGYEWEKDVSAGWRFVGVHVRWNRWVEEVAIGMLRRVLGVLEGGDLPPFIAVHVRRDDFDAGWCRSHPEAECHPPLPVYRNRVHQVQEALAEKFGADAKFGNVQNVIVTSDEKNATWWAEVSGMGYMYIDHGAEKTVERYGKWYPAIIDAVVQSMSIGFVGTQRSTMSRVAALRVRDWNGGVMRMVHWNSGKGERKREESDDVLEPFVD